MAVVEKRIGRPPGKPEPGYARKPPEVRRTELIEAAISCLARGGMSAFTVDNIRKQAGVSRGLINHYFASKDDLLACVYETMSDYVVEASHRIMADPSVAPVDRLNAFVEVSFNPDAFDRSRLRAWLTLYGEIPTNARLRRLYHKRYELYRTDLERAISAIAEERGLEVDVGYLAINLIALIDGLWLESSLDPSVLSPSDAAAACYDLVESKLGSIRH